MAIGIGRRQFISALGTAAAWPLAARAQQAERIRRVAVLAPYTERDAVGQNDVAVFTRELQRFGWEEGRNLHLEYRAAGPNVERLQSAAADLVSLKPEAMFVVSSAALQAARVSTNTIPIVFVAVTDPVGQGFVASLAHPAGNITGFTNFEFSIGPKWLQLLKEVSPGLRRVAVIFHPETTPTGWLSPIKSAGPALSLEVDEAAVHDDNEIDAAIAALITASDGGVIVLPAVFTLVHRQRIVDLAARHRLPAVYWDRSFVKDGGLMSYADNHDERNRQAAGYVDHILKGEQPADLPVQAPTKYQLVVNLKTAKALGLTISSGVLAIADEVIE
jgi:putative ABC transport system substrate-binding protein